ncbi:MAG: glycosyltransferase family 87 protein, partial [Acidimicrobiales bacterium]
VLNRPDVRTIYPAVAEGWFDLVHLFNPGDAGSRPWQIAGGLVDDATIVLMVVALRDRKRDVREVAWYALSPLPVIEFAGNGHVDGLALVLMVGALVALARNRRALAGVLIGGAIMIKLYPAVALAAFWRKGRFRMAIAALVTCVVTEAPHVIVVGRKVLGYLPGYLKEEHYESGGRFLLLNLLDIHGSWALRVAVVLLVLAAVIVAFSRLEPAAGLAILLGALILLATPVQPWYAVVAGGVAVIAGVPSVLALALAAEPYYATVVLPEKHQVGIGRASHGGAALIVAIALLWRWRQVRAAKCASNSRAEDAMIHANGGDPGSG